jgi:hypothetical protein
MCEFLRRPGDYTNTSSSGYPRDVVVDSSFPNVKVTYSTQQISSTSALSDLRKYMNSNVEEISALEKTNPELYALLLRMAYGDSSGF